MKVADSKSRVRAAWASLAGLDDLARLCVIVGERSWLGRPGWIAVLQINGLVTAVSPTRRLVEPLRQALDGLPPHEAIDPDRVIARLPSVAETLGPALLHYPGDRLADAPAGCPVDVVPPRALQPLFADVAPSELDESGLSEVTSPISIVRSDNGTPVAACGYRQWPAQVAHLSVLTRSDHRGRGFAKAVAIDATERALTEGLLPQWRAHRDNPASQAVAIGIGFEPFGAQLSLRPADT